MIEKPTVKELLEHVENRYALVIAASKRAREVSNGDTVLVETDETAPVTIAANEIVAGKVKIVEDEKEETAENEENNEIEESKEEE